jgi:hypothetical protein
MAWFYYARQLEPVMEIVAVKDRLDSPKVVLDFYIHHKNNIAND